MEAIAIVFVLDHQYRYVTINLDKITLDCIALLLRFVLLHQEENKEQLMVVTSVPKAFFIISFLLVVCAA